MRQYLDLLTRVLGSGTVKADRTGTGTLSVFGHQMRFDLGQGFPAATTKRLHMKSVIAGLVWFLRIDDFMESDVTLVGYDRYRAVKAPIAV